MSPSRLWLRSIIAVTGYKTELTINPLDKGDAVALNAVAVMDALGPVYDEN